MRSCALLFAVLVGCQSQAVPDPDAASVRLPPVTSVSPIGLQATAQGVMVTTGVPDHEVMVRFAEWGRTPIEVSRVEPTQLELAQTRPDASRFEFARTGIVEWYELRDAGVKQGFDIATRPSGTDPLRLVFDIESTMLPVLHKGATGASDSVAFIDETGRAAVTYSGLVTFDATGATVDSWMELDCSSACQLSLVVDDSDATYPIQVDPLFLLNLNVFDNPDTTTPENDNFGRVVSVDGDWAIIGASADDSGPNSNRGDVTLLMRTNGVWAEVPEPDLADCATPTVFNDLVGQAGSQCGRAVALEGDRAVVGCSAYDPASTLNAGTGVVLVRNGMDWCIEDQLDPDTPLERQLIGYSADINPAGDRVVLGGIASNVTDDDGNVLTLAGRALIFERTGSTWSQVADVTHPSGEMDDHFGFAVAISDDVAVVGAERLTNATAATGTRHGSTVFYSRNAMGAWAPVQTEFSTTNNERFGRSLAIEGTTVLVGAINGGGGSIRVYEETATDTWTLQQTLIPDDRAAGDGFGASVALDGDRMVVGSLRDESSGFTDGGSTYIYQKVGGVWAEEEEIFLTAAQGGLNVQRFGEDVDVSGDWVIVGTNPGDQTTAGVTNLESAFVFELQECDPETGAAGCDVDLNVTEVHPAPLHASAGQFIEIQQSGLTSVNLNGLGVMTSSGTVSITDDIVLYPGEYVLIASTDVALDNGGLPAERLIVDPLFALASAADTVTLIGSDASVLDTVTYSGFTSVGASLQLNIESGTYDDGAESYAGPADPGNWCEAWAPFVPSSSTDDFMTPGADNDACTRTFPVNFSYDATTGGIFASGSTTVSLRTDGLFTTGNSGVGTYVRTTAAGGQSMSLAYFDIDGDPLVTYVADDRAFGTSCFDSGDMTDLPATVTGGEWDNCDCDLDASEPLCP